MKVSVIIRVYNAEKTIRKAVASALNQDFPKKDFEIIIVNDGSTDNSLEILKSYKKKIRLINQKNQGAVAAANRGFKEARGKYIIILDADDCFETNILREMVAVLDKRPQVDFIYSDYYEKSKEGEIKLISTKNIFNTVASGIMFRKSKFKKEGFYREDIKFPEYDLLLKTQDKWQGHHLAKPLFYYNRKEESLTGDKKWVKTALSELRKLHPKKLEEIKKIRKY